MSESGFRRLLDIGDKQIRKELQDDYYFISKNRMENFVYCLESGAKELDELKSENASLREEVKALESRLAAAIDLLDDVKPSEMESITGIDRVKCQQLLRKICWMP